jgi:hypothetical protein
MSPSEIELVHAKPFRPRVSLAEAAAEESAMISITTPRPPDPNATHIFTLPIVRELPPVQRPGTFAETW